MTHYVPLELIDPNPWQPRQIYDPAGLQELADKITAHADSRPDTFGLLHLPAARLVDASDPTRLLPIDHLPENGNLADTLFLVDGRMQLAYGHRRMAAFKTLGLELLPVVIGSFSDAEMADMAWTENSARKDLTPLEEAAFIQRLMADFNLNRGQVAERLKMAPETVSNKLALLRLPDQVRTPLQEGKLSERQAIALRALYDMPEGIIKRAQSGYNGETRPSTILEDAMNGASSDNLRTRVHLVLERNATNLKNADWDLRREFPAHFEIQHTSCQGCPMRVDQNGDRYCGHRSCFEARKKVFQNEYLAMASAKTGIPVLPPDKARYEAHDFGWSGEQQYISAILARTTRCENLCLAWHEGQSKAPGYVDGMPHAQVVCLKRRQYCTCQNGLKAAEEQARRAPVKASSPTVDEIEGEVSAPAGKSLAQVFDEQDLEALARQARAEQKARRDQVKTLKAAAAGVIAKAIQEGHTGAWWFIIRRISWNQASGYEKDTIAELQATIAAKIVEHDLSVYGDEDDLERALSKINNELQKAGLPLLSPDGSLSSTPSADNPVARLAHRWERFKIWFDNLPKAPPTLEASRGNLANLYKMAKDLADLEDEELLGPLLDEDAGLAIHTERLEDLVEVLESPAWAAVALDDYSHISWLCHTPAGDDNFKSHLKDAPEGVLAYALAWLSGGPGLATRAGAVHSRLNALRKQSTA